MDWLDGIRRLQALTEAISDGEELVTRLEAEDSPRALRDALTVSLLLTHMYSYLAGVRTKGL